MKFTVTSKHIAKGKRCSAFECPVALAIRSKVRRVAAVAWGWKNITIGSRRPIAYVMPDEVSDFVNAYDSGEAVEPFTFLLTKKAVLK